MSSTPDSDSVERRLTRVVEQLQIPSSTLQITQVRLNRLGTEPDVEDDRMDEVAAAALALSAREDGLPVSEREIADTWTDVLDTASVDGSVSPDQLTAQLTAVAEYLDIDDPPSNPNTLIQAYGERLGMSDRLVEVGKRLLHDAFEADPTVVAGGTSPSGTAGATLYLAAEINGYDDTYGQDSLGDVSETSEVTVRNRYRELRDLLGAERLQAARYQLNGSPNRTATAEDDVQTQPTASETDTEEPETMSSTADDSDASEEHAAYVETIQSMYPDELPTTASVAAEHDADEDAVHEALESLAADGTIQEKLAGSTAVWVPAEQDAVSQDLTVDAVETEVDALAEELDVSPSARLFARGMVSDAAEDIDVEEAGKLAGAALVAAARMEDADLETTDVAGQREFETRAVDQWLDRLEATVDVEIPRLDAEAIVDKLVSELSLSEEVREESVLALEQYRGEEIDADYTAAELGAGAVFFAATVGRTQVDIEDLARITGADAGYVTDAMNSVVVSLCLNLVRGTIDYEDCSWTTDLLESELSPDIGDSYTGRVIALAKTYTAGRESQHIDDATLDVVLGRE